MANGNSFEGPTVPPQDSKAKLAPLWRLLNAMPARVTGTTLAVAAAAAVLPDIHFHT